MLRHLLTLLFLVCAAVRYVVDNVVDLRPHVADKIDELANKMIAILKYPPLTGELVAKAKEELGKILWEKAAAKITAIYEQWAAPAAGKT